MSRKITDSRRARKIKPEPAARRIEPENITDALGAETQPVQSLSESGPVSFLALHQRMASELISTGGRPSRRGATVRRKVPMSEQEWSELEKVAEILGGIGIKTSPGQVAGFLLERSLQQLIHELAAIEQDANQVLEAAASSDTLLHELGPVADELLRRMKLRRLAEIFPQLDALKE